jgi:3-hydroxymyristoyl/3-hydroxydecanoyl-(acyl carrier protein) dehydratase
MGHFRAFSFVDRITQLDVGKRGAGRYLVPAYLSRFSSCFAVEAAGQLAAWVAMAALDFEVRPVAGVAADLRFGADVRPGQALDLSINIDSCDRQAVTYSARAYAEGAMVVELEHSAGPMLPMEIFDAPDAMRSRFELLCSRGAPGGQFTGVPEHDIEIVEEVHGKSLRALLRVPDEAVFFSDHFARRPVFPGTMLLDAHIQMSLAAAAHSGYWSPGVRVTATGVPDMKLRAFISPGDLVELRVDLSPPDERDVVLAKTGARVNGKRVGLGSVELAARGGGQ